MMDILEKLRDDSWPNDYASIEEWAAQRKEAAGEIKRLRLEIHNLHERLESTERAYDSARKRF